MRRRMFVAVLLAVVLGCAGLAYAATPEPSASPSAEASGRSDMMSLAVYLVDQESKPAKDVPILIQKDMQSEQAYEGATDDKGELVIPWFPLSTFVLATRDEDNAVSGIVQISLYPGDETKILNHPLTDETIDARELSGTAFARNATGTSRMSVAANDIPVNRYEVQVARNAPGIDMHFQEQEGSGLELMRVATGTAAEVPPEPTLPPDDPDAPSGSPSASETSSPTGSSTATASPGPTESPSAASDAPTATPTPTQAPSAATQEPTPSPTATQTPAPTTQPPVQTTAAPTASRTPAPTTGASSQPTTQSTYINMKLFLKSPSGEALSYYVATLNNVATATSNQNGESYFMNIATDQTNTLNVANPQGVQVGTCGIRFIQGSTTTLASVNTGGTYTINYAPGQQDVYVEIVVDTTGNAQSQITLSDASGTPLTPGTVATPTAAPSELAQATTAAPTPTQNTGQTDVIGTPAPTVAPITGPSLSGYFSNPAGIAIQGATVRLLNMDTKNLSSSVTNSEGAFGMSHVPPGNYYMTATSSDGRSLGGVEFTAARGSRTRLKTAKDGELYLSEGNDPAVYVDLREMGDGRMNLVYASKDPLAAPAVLTIPSDSPDGSAVPTVDQLLVAEESEFVMLEPTRPPAGEGDASTLILVLSLVGAGAAVAAILLVRRAHIR